MLTPTVSEYLCLCGCMYFSVAVCICNPTDTHLLYEKHITLQMTLLDGDAPFKYSALMQSTVNTLNQAAVEEAAYLSSLPLSPSFLLLLSFIAFLPLSFHLFCLFVLYQFHRICLIFLSCTFWFPSLSPPLSESAVLYCTDLVYSFFAFCRYPP